MTIPLLYALTGVAIFGFSFFSLTIFDHLLRKVLALAVMGSAVFLVLVALADRTGEEPDPVPHVMVLTGIVVAVSGLTLALVLVRRIHSETGRARLPED